MDKKTEAHRRGETAPRTPSSELRSTQAYNPGLLLMTPNSSQASALSSASKNQGFSQAQSRQACPIASEDLGGLSDEVLVSDPVNHLLSLQAFT